MFKDKRRILIYAVAPTSLSLLFIALYFSGIEILQTIASPASQREFGLIENAQNLLLLSAAVICWRAARLEKQDT